MASTPVLTNLFADLAADNTNAISLAQGQQSETATQTDAFNMTPGERSLKARVMSLIENRRPQKALEILADKASPELIEEIEPELKAAIKDIRGEDYLRDSALRDLESIAALAKETLEITQPKIEEPRLAAQGWSLG